MELLIGTDSSGLPLYRELNYFIGSIKESRITVYYNQWLASPNGTRLQEEEKRYFVIDTPEIIIPAIVVSPATFDEFGVVVTEAVITPAVVTPAKPSFTQWKEKIIIQQYVGAKLGDDIIIGSIHGTLTALPIDVSNNHYV